MAITLWIITLIDEKKWKFMDVTTFYIIYKHAITFPHKAV